MGWIATPVWSAAKILVPVLDKLAAAHRERRSVVASYVEHMAATIDAVHAHLREHKPPHEPFARLRVYAGQIPNVMGGLLPEDDVQDLVELLSMTQKPEEMLRDFEDPTYGEIIAAELAEASGTLKALADSIRALP